MKKKPKALKPQTASQKIPSSKASIDKAANTSKSIRIEKPFPIPPPVRAVLNRLHQEGFVAYVVGGSVRDFLRGETPKDYDIATSANPDELEKLFSNALTVGRAFGVFKVPIESKEPDVHEFVEVATFRSDLDYKDHRHPESVEFKGPQEDAERRDFTVNALFFDLKTQTIIDFVGGFADLKSRTLRAIGHPSLRFKEDALRLLRAVRFSVRFGFTIEEETKKAIQMRSNLIEKISAERVRDELSLMLLGRDPHLAFRKLKELGLLERILPEVPTIPERELEWMSKLHEKTSLELAWATLLVNSEKTEPVTTRLRLSNEQVLAIEYLVTNISKFREVFRMREATLIRWISHPQFENLLKLHRSVSVATDGNLAAYEFCLSRYREVRQARANDPLFGEKLITGEDLIQLGLKPGPLFSEILHTVDDLALEKRFKTKEEALEFVVKYFVH